MFSADLPVWLACQNVGFISRVLHDSRRWPSVDISEVKGSCGWNSILKAVSSIWDTTGLGNMIADTFGPKRGLSSCYFSGIAKYALSFFLFKHIATHTLRFDPCGSAATTWGGSALAAASLSRHHKQYEALLISIKWEESRPWDVFVSFHCLVQGRNITRGCVALKALQYLIEFGCLEQQSYVIVVLITFQCTLSRLPFFTASIGELREL